MRYLLIASILFAVSMVPSSSRAANQNGTYTVAGPGTASCGRWTEGRRAMASPQRTVTDDLIGEEMWVLGFITAYNEYVWTGKNVSSETDSSGMFAWIDNYCAGHPTNDVADAAYNLIDFLEATPHPNDK